MTGSYLCDAASAGASAQRAAIAATIGGRLIGDARVIIAVGQALDGRAAAKEELGAAGIADRPTALAVIELEQRAALPDRNDVLHHFGLGLDVLLIHRSERRIAAHGRAREPHHAGRARLARPRR